MGSFASRRTRCSDKIRLKTAKKTYFERVLNVDYSTTTGIIGITFHLGGFARVIACTAIVR
jgi:hypothetical protein